MTDATAAAFRAAPAPVPTLSRPAWRLDWLTPFRCRLILLALLLFQVVPRVIYLNSPDALGLAPDEAQYWVWSRQLDWSYYSKGPMVALIIRASTELFGHTMPAVRYPAILIGVGMTLMTYWLTRRLFGSDRLALGAVSLSFVVPMFIAGSMLMTIDPPFVFFWAAATCLFMKALLGGGGGSIGRGRWSGEPGPFWAWPAAGLMVGLSFLAKYAAFFLFAGLIAAIVSDRRLWRFLRSPGPYVALLVAVACTFPVVYWNQQHGWATAKHVQADTTSGFNPLQPLEFFGGQFGVVGPFLSIILIAGLVLAFRRSYARSGSSSSEAAGHDTPESARRARLLALTVLPYGIVVFGSSFVTNAQLNWTAPLWFALLIVGAWFLATRLADVALWKPWRGFVWATVAFALVLMPLAHNVRVLYPVFAWIQTNVMGKMVRVKGDEAVRATMTPEARKKSEISVRRWDPTARLVGWKELALDLHQRRLDHLGADAFILTDDYADSSALQFYTPGQPNTYVMGPYIEDPKRRGRTSQWDIWPDRSLERGKTALLGRNAIYIGTRWQTIVDSFERVEPLGPIHEMYVPVSGTYYHIGGYRVWGCYNFKGMTRPNDGVNAW